MDTYIQCKYIYIKQIDTDDDITNSSDQSFSEFQVFTDDDQLIDVTDVIFIRDGHIAVDLMDVNGQWCPRYFTTWRSKTREITYNTVLHMISTPDVLVKDLQKE